MIDIKDIMFERMLLENRKYGPCRRIFDNGQATFAAIRDMFKNAIGAGVNVVPRLNENDNTVLAAEIPEGFNYQFIDADMAENVIDKGFEKFIDGLGWKCSLEQYVNDGYSRFLVNAARKYGIDVSRISDFIKNFVSRLSWMSKKRPTRSDLTTYAKLDGIHTRNGQYCQFLNDMEYAAEKTNTEIIRPIEEFVMELCIMVMTNIYGIARLDSSSASRRIMSRLNHECPVLAKYENTRNGTKIFKQDLVNLVKYAESLPEDGIRIRKNGKIYSIIGNFNDLDKIISFVVGDLV